MERIMISKKKSLKLKKDYKECLQLKKEKDLTEYGKGMLYVLDIIFS